MTTLSDKVSNAFNNQKLDILEKNLKALYGLLQTGAYDSTALPMYDRENNIISTFVPYNDASNEGTISVLINSIREALPLLAGNSKLHGEIYQLEQTLVNMGFTD